MLIQSVPKGEIDRVHLLSDEGRRKPKAVCGSKTWVSLSSEKKDVDCKECLAA